MAKVEPKIFDELKKALSSFDGKYLVGEELNRSKLTDDLRNYDETLLSKLFEVEFIKQHFIKEVAGQKLFQIEQLEEAILYNDYWDTSYTKYENRVGLASKGKFLQDSQDVVLDFPFKDGVLTASMTKENSEDGYDDAFLNEVIEKDEIDRLFDMKILTNVKRFGDNSSVSVDNGVVSFDKEKDNLIIKGNNLLALHTLKEFYTGQVKLIYIDPPYNTGNDSFSYNDKFNQSAWLTFMKNRLEIARELLTDDGVIFVSIDRNEFAELKLLMDEVFEKAYLGTVINVSAPNGRDYGSFAQTHEYIHAYAKELESAKTFALDVSDTKFKQEDEFSKYYLHPLFNSNSAFHKGNRPNLYYPFYVSENIDEKGYSTVSLEKDEQHTVEVYPPISKTDGTQFVWRWGKEKSKALGKTELVGQIKADGTYRIAQKMRPKQQIPRTIWQDAKFSNRRGTEELQKLFNGKIFSFPKPENLLSEIIKIGSDEQDLVLDFHMGSATTQAVAMKMNRRFIGIEQMDYINTVSVPRLQKVIEGEQGGISKDVNWQGGGSFVYAELFPKNMGYLQDIIHSKTVDELKSVYKRMLLGTDTDEPADITFRADLSKIDWTEGFDENKRLLIKLLDKNGLYYNYSEIDDKNVRDLISDEDYDFNKAFYEGGE
ncbi:site-specific DNA-methyltransferase [Bacillus vallismortis]|uniref:site-specific DNA-methyltransferase n=2 Tax=Bacillus vallismortis TaxID=72361 RepID=UPI002DB939A0|nr:site-specific DNA-methyltransferase [Bacillus vallismortis]MEC1269290.1 site-specific DNA-methyltransferase [Bacillus vallismortis]